MLHVADSLPHAEALAMRAEAAGARPLPAVACRYVQRDRCLSVGVVACRDAAGATEGFAVVGSVLVVPR